MNVQGIGSRWVDFNGCGITKRMDILKKEGQGFPGIGGQDTDASDEGCRASDVSEREGQESASDSQIIVKPDGSRVLIVTTRIGGMQTTMSLKISDPTDMPNQVHHSEEEETEFSQSINRSEQTKKESAVDGYIARHPENAAHVHQQVSMGKKFLARSGADAISREDMSMGEYKSFIMGLLYSVPFDSTRCYDKEIISISEKGWEQMKNDADYEAWIFGYTVENRSVRNPFAGWGGMSGSFCIEQFGASIEEHHGQSFPMQESGRNRTGNRKDEESWWDKRQKRSKELMQKKIKKHA